MKAKRFSNVAVRQMHLNENGYIKDIQNIDDFVINSSIDKMKHSRNMKLSDKFVHRTFNESNQTTVSPKADYIYSHRGMYTSRKFSTSNVDTVIKRMVPNN